jgi:hypothetical protein
MRLTNELLPNHFGAENWPFLGDLVQVGAQELVVGHV